MKSSVITFPGSNCDRDMEVALKNNPEAQALNSDWTFKI